MSFTVKRRRRSNSALCSFAWANEKLITRAQRMLAFESLESRQVLAILVADALGGSADTAIAGTVYDDVNGDGAKNNGESGIAGWTVYLDLDSSGTLNHDATGVIEPSVVTNADGDYIIDHLKPNTYRIAEVVVGGWTPSPTTHSYLDVLVRDTHETKADFFNVNSVALTGGIRGTVWNDVNADGVRNTDPGTGAFTDPALSGWTIFLDLNNNRDLDLGEPSTVTNVDGVYTFADLTPGDYEVVEILPAGWDVSPAYDNKQTVTVSEGVEVVAGDFANFSNSTGSIRGTAWNDLDGDGVRAVDPGSGAFTEPGLEGWTIYLDLNRNSIADPTEPAALTDVNGNYTFVGLQVGDYEVREILPVGWEVSPTFGDSYGVAVFGGTESVAPDFANFNIGIGVPGAISGVVWNDLDGNGVRDVDPTSGAFVEPGLAGVTLFVDLNFDGVPSVGEPQAVSAADGSYSFTGILPGSVLIVEQMPTGWRATSPVGGAQSIALGSGQHVVDFNFGNREIQDAAIRGVIFVDSNKDGLRGAGERGLPGITVYLDLNSNGSFDAGEPQTVSSTDLFFTPGVDEAGTYSFTHLAAGTYHVREVVPIEQSATPVTNRTHDVTLLSTESHNGIDFANVFRANQIHGVDFNDFNGNHVRDAGETGIGGSTVFIDTNRDNIWQPGEPTTTTLGDGSYVFTDLVPGAYVVRRVHSSDYEHTYPGTLGGILWPAGVSNPAVGIVSPQSITVSLAEGASHSETVSLTLPNTGALTNLVDVFLLFDDTGSFVNNSPIVRAAFPTIISTLQAALPGIDLGFGVGRFEEYGNFAFEYSTGRPFVLNQPIVSASTPGYLTAIQAGLDRETPGYGGDQPETDVEALYQLVTGAGFDGNNNGSVLDSGAAGLATTQLNPGDSGDVPSFASFQADPANNVMAAVGTIGGAGFRAGALPIILTATDTGFAYQPKGETTISGLGGVTLPVSAFTETSRPTTPFDSGAGIQQTITALNALGALVIGLGTNPESNLDPRQGLEAISKLTGATNQSAATIANGTIDPIAPGDPFYFEIASGFGSSVANGVVSAIQNAVTNVAVNITVRASDPRVHIINHTGVRSGIGAGQTATFDIEFVGDGRPHRFDLQFVREGTGVVLGSIPVVLGTPVPGDGYEFEDLDEGEIEDQSNFGSRLTALSGVVNRGLSYNNSFFDSYSPDATAADDSALASDKSPLLPGGTATFSNYSSYSRGINGLVVDIASPAHTPTVDDFAFKIGNSNDPSTWTAAPAPVGVVVRSAAGVGGSTRVEIVWSDGAVKNTWLQVKVNTTLGLSAPDVFYFGNAVGESGGSNDALVSATDEIQARNNSRTFLDPAPVNFNYDYNRDGFVNATDQIIARSNSTTVATALHLISVPAAVATAIAPSAAVDLVHASAVLPPPLSAVAAPSLPRPTEVAVPWAHRFASWEEDEDSLSAAIQFDRVQLPPDRAIAARFRTGLAAVPAQSADDITNLVDDELLELLAVHWSGIDRG